jgi:hypothetical protein
MAKTPQDLFKTAGGNSDASDALANFENNLQTLTFEHCFSESGVRFKAFLVNFQDQYESNWNQEDVFGRNDPIQIFQNTKRKISITWGVPSFDIEEASRNLAKTSKLIHMLYPAYESGNNQTNIAAGPVFKIRFSNLICSSQGGSLGPLYCTLNGMTMNPDLEAGFFISDTTDSLERSIFPKSFELSTQLTVIHTHRLGWGATADEAFPIDSVGGFSEGTVTPDAAYQQSSYPYGIQKFKAFTPADKPEVSEEDRERPPTSPESKVAKKGVDGALAGIVGDTKKR